MQPLALQYNILAGGQALDSTLQAVITQVVAAMTAAFTEIKGATWSATDTLEQIRDNASGLDAAGVRAAIGLASANLDTQLDALPTASEIADAVAAIDVSGYTLQEASRVMLGAMAGKSSVSGTTYTIRKADDSGDVITATVVGGARTEVVVDAS